jgi:dTDP-glucose pyrophosphorylase/CBS domain-containing protein
VTDLSASSTSRLDGLIIDPAASIADALSRIDQAGTGGLVVCSPDRKVVGFLTDGDIRRAILQGIPQDRPCGTVANRSPITARGPLSAGEALYLMGRHDVNQLPVVDEEGILQDFLLRKDLATSEALEDSAKRRFESVIISPEASITEAISQLDRAGTGALVLCVAGRRLFGLLTDGDLRRAILHGVSLDDPCETIAITSPITAKGSVSAGDALRLMVQHDIDQLPVLDSEGNLTDFLLRKDLLVDIRPVLSAVIMAGGLGKRLLPLTEHVPKPMLPVGDRPLLERTIQQLRRAGIRDVSLTTHYLPENIVQHFGKGEEFGVRISYANEDQPLGTAGGLKLVKRPAGPFVVINGDILTGVSFEKMLEYHRAFEAEITVGVRRYEIEVPFGVVECDDVRITQLREKPSLTLFINAGIYLLEPTAWDSIPNDEHFDMTDLIRMLLDEGRTVVSYPIIEYWLDVGRPDDYRQAQEDLHDGPV